MMMMMMMMMMIDDDGKEEEEELWREKMMEKKKRRKPLGDDLWRECWGLVSVTAIGETENWQFFPPRKP